MARCTGLALWLAVVSGAIDAGTTTIQYNDFSDLSALTLNGSAATINPCFFDGQYVLRLTNNLSQAGSAYHTATIPLPNQASFSTYFAFQIANPMGIGDADGIGADGFCFVVQAVSNQALGGGGGDLGYSGIAHSLAIEFDTYPNGSDPNGNHIGVDTNGNLTSLATADVPTRLNDGGIWHAWVDYNGATQQLEVRLSTIGVRPPDPMLSRTVDLATILGTPDAYVGFTAATGGGSNTHDIRQWTFVNAYAPIQSLTARAFKQRAEATLAALLPTATKRTAQRLAAALKLVQSSLQSKFWVDDNHLTLSGDRVFHDENDAATRLENVLATPSLDPAIEAGVESALNDLVAADDTLALTAIADAQGNVVPGGQKQFTFAQEYCAAAQNLATVVSRSFSITLFRRSWLSAQRAMGRSPK